MERLVAVAESAYVRLFLLGLVLLGLQTTLLNDMRPFGVCLQVMLLMSASAGLAKGSEMGAIVGFMMGFMYDMVLTTPLGLSAVVFAAVGYVSGFANSFVHESTWWTRMLLGSVASMLGMFFMPIALSVVGIEGAFTSHVVIVMVVVGVSNALLSEMGVRACGWAMNAQSRVMV